jgi:F420-dependent oxidoreductase-like protein
MTGRRGLSRRRFLQGIGAVAAAAVVGEPLTGAAPAHAAPAAPGRLRFGFQTPPQHVTYRDLEDVWVEADGLGLDSAFVFDHFIPIFSDPSGPCFEGWTLLAALAARTKSMRVGVLVTGNTYRHPAVLAKMAATVDHTTNGRLILGVGAGWYEREHTAYGIPFHTPGGRARRLAEAVEVMKGLFAGDSTNLAGKYYTLKDAPFLPKPVQKPHPPILIGGMGPKVIQPLAARHADIWHFFIRDESDPAAEARRVCENFDRICGEVGRQPHAVEKATSVSLPGTTAADVKQVRDRIRGFADAGVRHFILSLRPPFERAVLRTFAKEVVPAFRDA